MRIKAPMIAMVSTGANHLGNTLDELRFMVCTDRTCSMARLDFFLWRGTFDPVGVAAAGAAAGAVGLLVAPIASAGSSEVGTQCKPIVTNKPAKVQKYVRVAAIAIPARLISR